MQTGVCRSALNTLDSPLWNVSWTMSLSLILTCVFSDFDICFSSDHLWSDLTSLLSMQKYTYTIWTNGRDAVKNLFYIIRRIYKKPQIIENFSYKCFTKLMKSLQTQQLTKLSNFQRESGEFLLLCISLQLLMWLLPPAVRLCFFQWQSTFFSRFDTRTCRPIREQLFLWLQSKLI